MTRPEVKEFLLSLGITEPTDEQITNFLNTQQREIQREKTIAEKYKADAIRAKDLEAQLEEINNKNLSDADLAKRETEKANSRIAELEKQIAISQRNAALANIGIVGDNASKLFGEDGGIDISVLGQIISDRENVAKTLKEQELLKGTPNPKGSDKGGGELSAADKMAVEVGKQIAAMNKSSNDVLNNYIK